MRERDHKRDNQRQRDTVREIMRGSNSYNRGQGDEVHTAKSVCLQCGWA